MPARRNIKQKARPRAAKKATQKPAAKSTGLKLRSASPSFTVNDLDRSVSWYCDVLGFIVKERWERDGRLMGVELAAGSVAFYIGQDDWKKGRDRVKGEGFRLYCDTTQDVDALARRIEAGGGSLLDPPYDEPWGARALTVTDPDGFKITISKG